ncbi:MAG: hypothetical protein AVDCRST_MAG54-2336 [uncultured Actinomycetospora sp.]|uniref:Uncharacterized protein n=1 Tax=uncultured Actinomycetospora sp. TaxID=1135996 RepID=A0A6J4INZ9_9PSEU|nr:MAG: hypothetical protein AVDCRST_MAG54-2336 [uncultured Actinomycetospora sp.]
MLRRLVENVRPGRHRPDRPLPPRAGLARRPDLAPAVTG